MSRDGPAGDFSALLYLVPFAVSGVYGLYLWVQAGLSAVLPSSVYLSVTRDPIVFVVGSLAILLGVVVEVTSTEPAERPAKLAATSSTLQTIAAASLTLALLSAWYANGFTDITGTATDFIVGRYGLVFPAMMVLLSYLVTGQFRLGAIRNGKVLGILAMLLVPVAMYELGKRQTVLGLVVAFVLLLIGTALFLTPWRGSKKAERK
jgi:hypothetical protein